ncbi:hypothetical protein HDE_12782 [Halotydeus destructor]|nr:hypothetical protein HDE_12782 [Halotydeus destructor]
MVDKVCPAPAVNPFDPMALKYFKRNLTYSCPKMAPLTQVNEYGLIGLTDYAITNDFSCNVSLFSSVYMYDYAVQYGPNQVLNSAGLKLNNTQNLANVSCSQDGGEIFHNSHYYIPTIKRSQDQNKPSVVIFVLESLSKLSFERFMPRSREAFEHLGHVHMFDNFVKPMENSFPNMMALLTGDRIPCNETGSELDEVTLSEDYLDNKLPFVWDDFQNGGYVTAYLEDMPSIGLFNYYPKKGFKKPPTDWYPIAYWLQMYPDMSKFDLYDVFDNTSQYCFEQNGAKVDIFFEQMLDFMKKYEAMRQPYFLMGFHSQMTHEDFNNFQLVDQSMANFVLGAEKYLDNTILILAGDHGPRFGPLVFEPIGLLETRMPFLAMRIPKQLDKRQPNLRKYLKANRASLMTWYDLHAFLKDVARGRFGRDFRRKSRSFNPSRSLIPRDRSCRDADIDDVFCVCDREIHLNDLASSDVDGAVAAINDYLAEILDPYVKTNRIEPQIMEKIINARYVMPRHGHDFGYVLRIKFTVSPSNVSLDETVSGIKEANGTSWTLDQSSQHREYVLSKFDICK